MKTITIERNGITYTFEASQKEIDLNQHITLIANVLNVHVDSKPKEPEVISNPARMLPYLQETTAQIMARITKDPCLSYKTVAKELGVSPHTVRKYLQFDLIAGEYHGKSMGWFVRRSELERLKDTPGWLKSYQKHVKNKPEPTPSDILHKKRLQVLDEIDDLWRYREPLNSGYMTRHNQGLLARARRYFGSWRNALYVAGIHYSQVYKRWDKPNAFKGRPGPTEKEKKRRANDLLKKIATWHYEGRLTHGKRRKYEFQVWKHFGGWQEVYRLLGIKDFDKTDGQRVKVRTRETIIAEIQELKKNGSPLNYSFMYKHQGALLKAAEKKFRGSWGAAVRAAGCENETVLHRWNKEKIIIEIRRMVMEGLPLYSHYLRKHSGALLSSAVKIFGSWSSAIEAAGLDYSRIKVKPWPPLQKKGNKQCLGGKVGKPDQSLVSCLNG